MKKDRVYMRDFFENFLKEIDTNKHMVLKVSDKVSYTLYANLLSRKNLTGVTTFTPNSKIVVDNKGIKHGEIVGAWFLQEKVITEVAFVGYSSTKDNDYILVFVEEPSSIFAVPKWIISFNKQGGIVSFEGQTGEKFEYQFVDEIADFLFKLAKRLPSARNISKVGYQDPDFFRVREVVQEKFTFTGKTLRPEGSRGPDFFDQIPKILQAVIHFLKRKIKFS